MPSFVRRFKYSQISTSMTRLVSCTHHLRSLRHFDLPSRFIPAPADDNHCLHLTFSQGTGTSLLQGHFPNFQCSVRGPTLLVLAIASISRYLPSQRPRATRQHYLRTRYHPHRFACLTFLPARVRDVSERTNIHFPPNARSSFHPTRARTLSSPAFLRSPTESAHAPAPPPSQRIIVTFPRCPRLALQQARQSPLSASAPPCNSRSTAPSSCPQTTLMPASRG
ncbi:hypothetical protein EDB89DRAFT_2022499, partial [Lactarius sanguifluus]